MTTNCTIKLKTFVRRRGPTTNPLYSGKRDGAKTLIDESGCCGGCHQSHEIVLMTIDEVKQRQPEWWTGPHRLEDEDLMTVLRIPNGTHGY